jgi:hypothetical protein
MARLYKPLIPGIESTGLFGLIKDDCPHILAAFFRPFRKPASSAAEMDSLGLILIRVRGL